MSWYMGMGIMFIQAGQDLPFNHIRCVGFSLAKVKSFSVSGSKVRVPLFLTRILLKIGLRLEMTFKRPKGAVSRVGYG